jgi:hypothetical protein
MDLLWNNRRKCLGNRQHYNSGETYSDQLEWTDGLGEPGEYIIRDRLEAAYTLPTSPGIHQYGATSLINGCRHMIKMEQP